MIEPVFKSSLSVEQIESNFKDMDYFEELMDGLTEVLAHSQGKAVADTDGQKADLSHRSE